MADGKDESLKESCPGFETLGILDARNIYSRSVEREEADYIDMEVGSAPAWEAAAAMSMMKSKLNNTIVRAESREFEFDMSGINAEAFENLEDAIASPADELFYKGQLLPLHLPPRLQMVEKLLASELKSRSPQSKTLVYLKAGNSSDLIATDHDDHRVDDTYEDFFFFEDDCADSINLTPYMSCHVSPYSSCDASQELHPDPHNNDNNNNNKNVRNIDRDQKINTSTPPAGSDKRKPRLPMLKKVKEFLASTQFKQSALAVKLRASRAYLKSLFTRSASSCGNKKKSRDSNNNIGGRCIDHRHDNRHDIDQHPSSSHRDIDPENMNIASRTQDISNLYRKAMKPEPWSSMLEPKELGAGSIRIQRRSFPAAAATIKSSNNSTGDINFNIRRKSFSGRLSSVMLSSEYADNQANSVMDSSSNRSYLGHSGRLLQRSSSANFDMENAIQGAIAHCKQSHASKNIVISKLASDSAGENVHGCPGADSRFADCDQPDKPGRCRG